MQGERGIFPNFFALAYAWPWGEKGQRNTLVHIIFFSRRDEISFIFVGAEAVKIAVCRYQYAGLAFLEGKIDLFLHRVGEVFAVPRLDVRKNSFRLCGDFVPYMVAMQYFLRMRTWVSSRSGPSSLSVSHWAKSSSFRFF